MTLTNWAAIAAKGTSHTVSISSTPSNGRNKVETSRKSSGNIENESTCTVPSSSSSTSSNEDHCSPTTTTATTTTTTTTATPKDTRVVPTKPIPAPAPIKNPWKIQEIIRQREEKKDDTIAPDLLTPAESKDIKSVVRESPILSETTTAASAASSSSNAVPTATNGKQASSKLSKGTNGVMNGGPNGPQKNTSLKKTLQHNGTIVNSKIESKENKDASRKNNTSLDKTKSKMNASSSSQGTTMDSNHTNDTKVESDHRNNINHSSVSTKKKAMVTSSTSDHATSSNTTSTSPKKKVAKQVANNMKSNISSNKTKTNNKTKKNANKKKNKSHKNHLGKMNNNAYYYVPAPEEMEALKLAAVVQIEYFFSIDELVRNIYLRKQMDCEGYLPAAVVFNFPSVLSYCIPYYDLLAAVDVHAQTIEVDFENECLRLKGGEAVYKKWLMPNPDGTLGCAKWIKEVPQSVEENSSVPFDAAESVSTGLMRGESLNKVSPSMEEEKKEDDERDSHVLANQVDQ